MKRLLPCVMMSLVLAQSATAQNVVSDTVKDPTTYIPMVASYVGTQLDWNSSQPYFARGATEANPRFTQTGRPFSAPLSYGDGNRTIVIDALSVGALSVVNNVAMRMIERRFESRDPAHQPTWRRLGRIERVVFASVAAFEMSHLHFEQWRNNVSTPLR